MQQQQIEVTADEVATLMQSLSDHNVRHGRKTLKTKSELKAEAKRKAVQRRCRELVPSLSLYALRHSWATNALQRGVDALTVAILMGHKDPSTLARTYQHLSHNPEHLLEQARRAAG